MLVDDQQLMLNLLKGILKTGGYKKIAFAMTGKQALATVKKHPVDMIISDWSMPNMSGVELLKLVRGNPAYCDIPFVMITGEIDREKIIHAMEEGVDDYLIKPLTPKKVLATIDRIMAEISNPESMRNKSMNAFRLKHLGKYEEAIALAHKVLGTIENQELYLALSECYLRTLDLDNAVKFGEKALVLKKSGKACHLLGQIHLKGKNYENAVKYFERSMEMSPSDMGRKVAIGSAYLKSGLTDEAEAIFQSLTESEITDLQCVDIGAAYLASGNLDKADKYLTRVVDPIAESLPVFNKFATGLQKAGRYDHSIKQYGICLGIEPQNPKVLFNLGCLYLETGKLEKAQKALEKSLALRPDDGNTKKLLGHIRSTIAGPGGK